MLSMIRSCHSMMQLHTLLYQNALQDISEEQARKQYNQNVNTVIFIASHLLDGRYYLAEYLDIPAVHPFRKIFDSVQSVEDSEKLPPLREILSGWEVLSEKLTMNFPDLEENQLLAASPVSFPIDDQSILGGTTFLLSHESYYIGQLGLIRKLMELPSMKFS